MPGNYNEERFGEIIRRHEEIFRVGNVFIILIVVIISGLFICYNLSIVYFKYVQLTICQLYSNKAIKKDTAHVIKGNNIMKNRKFRNSPMDM